MLRTEYFQKNKQGFALFFTGLSGSGKTTLAQALRIRLMSLGQTKLTLLDGDVLRNILSKELGFSKEDRHINICRMGFVASQIIKVGGIAICSAIAPYAMSRAENRRLISQHGGYIEIYLSTSLEECEKRDPKGLYQKARAGEIKAFTGISDPYEIPVDSELILDTTLSNVQELVEQIINFLNQFGYLPTETQELYSADELTTLG